MDIIKRKTENRVINNHKTITSNNNKLKNFFSFKKTLKTIKSKIKNTLFKTKKRKLITSLILILLIVTPISFYLFNKQAKADWWNDDWHYRKSITINSSQVAGDLTNFPMLVSITDSDLSNKAQANGNDIVFTLNNGTRLDHEIEK